MFVRRCGVGSLGAVVATASRYQLAVMPIARSESARRARRPIARAKAFARRAAKRPELKRAASRIEGRVTDAFHRMYYGQPQRTWQNTTWLGTRVLKCPLDLWIYQELLARVRPDVILETGTNYGGGAHYLASICELLDHGRVISVDVKSRPDRPQHPRVSYLHGSSTSPEVLRQLSAEATGTVMVILDSDHSRAHVLDELVAYAPLVSSGSYLIVEDTNVGGHPARPSFGPGPMEAVDEFLRSHPEFSVDRECEKFFMTFNPRGYLRRS
jgi:cephalosporin hydroxylase